MCCDSVLHNPVECKYYIHTYGWTFRMLKFLRI